MATHTYERSVHGMLAALASAAIVGSVWLLALGPYSIRSWPLFTLLMCLAALAEMLPVELPRQGVRITFTLPYVAALMACLSPWTALTADMLATCAVGILYPVMRRQAGAPVWLGLNVVISMLSVVAGTLAGIIVGGHPVAVALAFMLGYGAANFGLVILVDAYTEGKGWADNAFSALRLSATSYLIFAFLGMIVATLATQNLLFALPLTFVPIWALRTGLDYQARMYDHYYETVLGLTQMLQRSHPYTHGHLERVAAIAEQVALNLGMSTRRARMVREAAILHDIGKIAVSEEILDKPARLTAEEFEHVKLHAPLGAKILRPVKPFREIAPWIRHHHERPDGTGYPDQLSDAEIPIESKIIAVVDAFDAMTGGENAAEKRTYREPKSQREALAELERCSGTQFDPKVVAAFREVLFRGVN